MMLDGPSLMYRAFFAVPPDAIKDPQGRPVNAVRGFLDMTRTLIADHKPDEVFAVLDADWRPAYRVAAYPGYKADRPPDPDQLPYQFEIVPEIAFAAGMTVVAAPDLEADDAIATLVDDLDPEDKALIVTGDRDLLALVRDPQVEVLFTVKGVRQLHRFDEAAVELKYGIPPRLYPEFAILRGDSSDGLPGIAGIGDKRAAALLQTYGSIDAIVEHLEELPPKQAAAFARAGDYLDAMKIVVTLVRDAHLEIDRPQGVDGDKLLDLGRRHGLDGAVARLLRPTGTTA